MQKFSNNAALINQLDIAQWLHENFKIIPESSCLGEVSTAMLDWIKLLDSTRINEIVAQNANASTLEWLSKNAYDHLFTDEIKKIQIASIDNHDKMVWIYDHWSRALPNSLDWAVEKGSVKSLKWTFEKTSFVPSLVPIILATANGHLKVLKWIYKNHPRLLDFQVVIVAINFGHLEIAKHFDPLFEQTRGETITLSLVCERGDLAMLKWVFGRYGHLPSAEEVAKAIEHGRLDVIEWILGIKDSTFEIQPQHIAGAICSGNHLLYQLLLSRSKEKYIVSQKDLEMVITKDFVPMLKTILKDQTDLAPNPYDMVVSMHIHHIWKWLVDNRSQVIERTV